MAQIYLGTAKRFSEEQSERSNSNADPKTGMFKLREYKPRKYEPKLREYKLHTYDKIKEFKPTEPPKFRSYDTYREYDHFYDVEPPSEVQHKPLRKKNTPFCKPYKAIGSIKRTLAISTPSDS